MLTVQAVRHSSNLAPLLMAIENIPRSTGAIHRFFWPNQKNEWIGCLKVYASSLYLSQLWLISNSIYDRFLCLEYTFLCFPFWGITFGISSQEYEALSYKHFQQPDLIQHNLDLYTAKTGMSVFFSTPHFYSRYEGEKVPFSWKWLWEVWDCPSFPNSSNTLRAFSPKLL